MKLKKMLVVALGVFTLLSNTVIVKAKTSKFHITPREYWTKVEFYTKEVVKGCLAHTDVKTPPDDNNPSKPNNEYIFLTNDTTLSDPMNVYEYFHGGGTRSYYTRRSKVSTKVSKPDTNGYVDTTVTFKILENLIHKPAEGTNYITEVGKVYDIYNPETLNSYRGITQEVTPESTFDIYNGEIGAVFTQVLDRYTGTNLMSGLKDVVDSNGVEFKNACEFKAKGKKWIVQVEAKKTAPTKKNPYGTLVFTVHHHKDYKGLAFGQFLGYSSPRGSFSGNISGALMSVDYSKRFKLADFMGDEWLHGDYTLVKYK